MRILILLAVALLLALAGCGGDDEESPAGASPAATAEGTPEAPAGGGYGGGGGGGGGGEELQLAAAEDGSLAFDKTELTAKAGTVTIKLDNPSSTPHAVEIEGNGVEEGSEIVTGAETSVSADLEAGEFTFYCPVGGHREAGMEGTLTVE